MTEHSIGVARNWSWEGRTEARRAKNRDRMPRTGWVSCLPHQLKVWGALKAPPQWGPVRSPCCMLILSMKMPPRKCIGCKFGSFLQKFAFTKLQLKLGRGAVVSYRPGYATVWAVNPTYCSCHEIVLKCFQSNSYSLYQ